MGNRYGYKHREERKRWVLVVARGDGVCAEVRCLMPSRWIPPGTEWHLAHDPSGTRYVGISHPACNTSEAATRMHADRKLARRVSRRWTL